MWDTQDCWQLTRAFLGRPHPEPLTLLNLPWNNFLMWHAAWHKTHSHLSLWMPPLYYKDTFSERISSYHKKKRQEERQGSATRAEKLKTNEQVSPRQLLKGMTTSTLCLFRLRWSVSPPERDPEGDHIYGISQTQRPAPRALFGAIIGTRGAEHCILRQQIMFCYAEECVISKNSCENQGRLCQMISDRFLWKTVKTIWTRH